MQLYLSPFAIPAFIILYTQLGTYNTVKATLPYIRESRGSYIHVSATLHYQGMHTNPWPHPQT